MEWKELHQVTKTQCLHNPEMLVTLTKSTAESEVVAAKLQKLDDSLAPPNQLLNNQTTVWM